MCGGGTNEVRRLGDLDRFVGRYVENTWVGKKIWSFVDPFPKLEAVVEPMICYKTGFQELLDSSAKDLPVRQNDLALPSLLHSRLYLGMVHG